MLAAMDQRTKALINEDALRAFYPAPVERARLKTLHKLDQPCANFIARSPLLCRESGGEAA
jgi:hypothetical protein